MGARVRSIRRFQYAANIGDAESRGQHSIFKFIKENYQDWLQADKDCPIMSHTLFKEKVFPLLEKNKPLFFIVIDNLRYDQWKIIEPELLSNFRVFQEDLYFSILPTATQYSRNAIFSGLMPLEMQKIFPQWWKNDNDDEGKNMFEEQFLNAQLQRLGKRDLRISYNKITNIDSGRKLSENMHKLLNNDLNVIVYNFVDMLSHARTDMKVIKELAEGDAAYRSLTASWFEHSPLEICLTSLQKIKPKYL